jgi:hypothetical protein
MTAARPEDHPKSELTLSAAQELDNRSDRTTADRFEDLLELHERALARGLTSLADWYADRIVDEMTAGAAR